MTRLAADWLSDPGVARVFDALEAAGGPDCARFVGGCVRNSLMGHAVDDLDIATTLRPEAVMAALTAAGLKSVPTGVDHGTVTAVAEGQGYEITTLRRDVTTDGRNATVAFTQDWAEDAQRRDFRLNALYADRAGRVFDPTGEGVADARAGRIVFVGEAGTRIREDYLRILRFFRFYAWYGRGAVDAAGLAACAGLSGGMGRLSAERVSKELLKLLAAPDPMAALSAMARAGVLARVLPAAETGEAFARMTTMSPDAVLRLSILLPRDPAAVEAVARGLRLSNAQRARLVAAAGDPVETTLDDRTARAALYRLGAAVFRDRLLRRWAETGEAGRAQALLALAADWTPPKTPVGGRDLARLGLTAGPQTGRILKAFEDGWVADDFPTEGHDARLRALIDDKGLPSG